MSFHLSITTKWMVSLDVCNKLTEFNICYIRVRSPDGNPIITQPSLNCTTRNPQKLRNLWNSEVILDQILKISVEEYLE